MRYKNAELFNVEELVKHDDGSVSWLRIPQNVYDALEVTEQGQSMAHSICLLTRVTPIYTALCGLPQS